MFQGTKGLSMFYLEIRDQDGNLNNIEVQRLKDKLGTRQLPTAELLLDGVKAYKVISFIIFVVVPVKATCQVITGILKFGNEL